MKRLLKIFLFVLAGIVAVLGSLIGLTVVAPQWIVNPTGLKIAVSLIGPEMGWEKVETHVTSFGLLDKKIDLRFQNLCVAISEKTYEGCVETASLSVRAAWKGGFQVLELGPVTVTGGQVVVHLTDKPEKESKPPRLALSVPDLVLPSFLRDTAFQSIELQVKRFEVWNPKGMIVAGDVQVSSQPVEGGHLKTVSALAHVDESSPFPIRGLQASLESPSYFLQNDWVLSADSHLELKENAGVGEIKLTASQEKPKYYKLRLESEFTQKKLKATANVDAELGEGNFLANLKLSAGGFTKVINNITTEKCVLSMQEMEASSAQAKISLDCPLRVDMSPLKLPSATFKKWITIPQNFDFIVKTDMETALFPSADKPVKGNLSIELAPVVQDLLNLKGKVITAFAGTPNQYPEGWKIDTNVDASLLIPYFEKVVKALNRTAFAVPAPLNPLKGTIELSLTGHADIDQMQGSVPVVFKTNLKSTDQSLNIEGKGDVKYQYAATGSVSDLTLELLLSDITLALPQLGYTSLPAFFPDARIKKEVPKKSNRKNEFNYHIKVATPPEHPARLISNFAKESIPINLNLLLENENVGGTVQIGSTPLNFFRRDARLESFTLTLQEPMNMSELNGQVNVSYIDYNITVLVLGTINKPRIVFESDPPLSDDEIISVLIYGKTFDDLTEDDANSASSLSAAVTDRAISLGSLMLLASTPIKSIGYDPDSGAFSAKVSLGGGTTFGFTNVPDKTQTFGLRKTLWKNWILNTYIETDQTTKKKTGTTFLEWNKRY